MKLKSALLLLLSITLYHATAQVDVRHLHQYHPEIDVMSSTSHLALYDTGTLDFRFISWISDVPFYIAYDASSTDTSLVITGFNLPYGAPATSSLNYVQLHTSNDQNAVVDTSIRYIGLKKLLAADTIYGWFSYQFKGARASTLPFPPYYSSVEYDSILFIDVAWNTIPDMPLWMGQDCYVFLNDTIDTVCAGTSITLNAIGGNNLRWSTGDSASSITVMPVQNTLYSITATGATQCIDSASVFVETIPLPAANIFIIEDSVLCTGESIHIIYQHNSTLSYQWQRDSTDLPGIYTDTFTASQQGVYTLIAANNCGTTTSNSIRISQSTPVAAISASPDFSICTGDTATLTAQDGVQFLWNDSTTAASLVTTHPGVYAVTATDPFGCSDTASASVTSLGSAPVADFTFVTRRDTATFTSISVDATSYLWNFGDTNTTTAADPQHIYFIDGVFTVCLLVHNVCGTDSICKDISIILPGIKSIAKTNMSLYPNPANEKLYLAVQHAAPVQHIRITDVGGKELLRAAQSPVDVAPLLPGLYLVHVELANGVHAVEKFMIAD